ncbi:MULTISPECIES: type II toxin-antitoxin system antitoxin DNA ADP-ribosyl glycohydrolase DarG [Lysinibacillus]|uniref:type II toxin-antitoxin system antitoxin DNA ADP-ribosyl glycohydrolase DarG n=1 Tax=Lysinibacillus TaxID=400634 RepID=UPI0021A92D7F|nr:macro domain-containing protein [Lysinibacillus capsici]MCT1538766.1 macro domain-containing protein [Lysinibacillus capsici]MCT1569474.1 macro domain-containing protein [Lysinibacillus capsici]MCT1646489.1 macro domain-containing protein [Lysinibacillus capsici]MCT1725005.1 macro domain-containing protein [Lysinibacillus capsici]MCT1784617.1 macro domain-containing protein [Lysinibacillus capsici]
MLNFKNDDLFNYVNKVDAIINTVNIVGVMGKGIALDFKKRYPENYSEYKKLCSQKLIDIGNSYVNTIKHSENGTKYIINLPTKKHWRNPSKLEYIEKGLDNLIDIIEKYNIKSLAMPALGCGNGNLDWTIVKPLIITKLSHLENIEIIVIEPSNKAKKIVPKPRLTIGRKRLLLLMDYYNANTSDDLITHIEVNLLSYLLNYSSSNTKFEMTRNGPFNKDINKLLIAFNTHYLTTIPTNKNNGTQIKVIASRIPSKKDVFSDDEFLRVKNLVDDFTNYSDLLILSMAHWFKFNEKSPTSFINQIKNWFDQNNHKYDEKIIIKAINRIEKIYSKSENLSLEL